jgi:site-specific recombinase XerD
MVTRVPLRGLKIYQRRKRWYVYVRGTPKALIKGFEGTREQLVAKLAEPDMLALYNATAKRDLTKVYEDGTLGSLVAWFKTLQEYKKLSEATRRDYDKAYEWMRPAYAIPLKSITTPSLYEVRDRCVNDKWPRFADQMITALSSMFTQAVKRDKMERNPCLGMDKAHTYNPNSNREWFEHEWEFVRNNAPMEILIPTMIARYAGLSGQTIVTLNLNQFFDHPLTGRAVSYTRRKNNKTTLLPVLVELQNFLADKKVQRRDGLIAVRDDGSMWRSEKQMQYRVSSWLRAQERKGKIGKGTTLHGLRVTYAAWWKRNGASDAEVTELIGDKSVRMGQHYTRHVESEVSITRAFERIKDVG